MRDEGDRKARSPSRSTNPDSEAQAVVQAASPAKEQSATAFRTADKRPKTCGDSADSGRDE